MDDIFNGYVLLFLIILDISLPFYYYNDSIENVIRISKFKSIFASVMLYNYTFLKKLLLLLLIAYGNGIKFLINYTCRDFFFSFSFDVLKILLPEFHLQESAGDDVQRL